MSDTHEGLLHHHVAIRDPDRDRGREVLDELLAEHCARRSEVGQGQLEDPAHRTGDLSRDLGLSIADPVELGKRAITELGLSADEAAEMVMSARRMARQATLDQIEEL